jgi:2-polyprenyl-3-methyl-5-hydroxy-6-metoxy-1,4-benzoquinol methylase
MMFLRERSSEPEIMDDLNCKGQVVEQTLRELDVINRMLGGNDVTIDGIERLLEDRSGTVNLTLADIGCGSGDMCIRISKWARTRGLDIQVTGIDANPNIINYAIENCRGTDSLRLEVMDVLGSEFSGMKWDIVVATLFMHHFTQSKLVRLFQTLNSQTRIGFVINDIHRHFLAYYSIRFLTRLFSRSAMVRYDAPLSVRRAFRRKELEEILGMAGISQYTIRWKWAFRWQVIVRK